MTMRGLEDKQKYFPFADAELLIEHREQSRELITVLFVNSVTVQHLEL